MLPIIVLQMYHLQKTSIANMLIVVFYIVPIPLGACCLLEAAFLMSLPTKFSSGGTVIGFDSVPLLSAVGRSSKVGIAGVCMCVHS